MAEGITSDFEQDSWINDCLECDVGESCCDESCEGLIWIAPCGSIDYTNGEILTMANFCQPPSVTSMSYDPGYTLREKKYRGCGKSRRPNEPDPSFTLGWDICQNDPAHALMLGRCAFDYVIAPKASSVDFATIASIFNQPTYMAWGRAIGDSLTWEFPDDECQSTSRTFMKDRYSWASSFVTS